MIQVAYPWVALAIILPIIIYYLLPKAQENRLSALKVPFFNQLQQSFNHGEGLGRQNKVIKKILVTSIFMLIIVSGMGIEWLGKPLTMPQTGRDLMLAIDLSGSMQTPDMQVGNQTLSRIDVVKDIAGQFIQQRNGDKLGLILFGSRPYLQTPLTFDRKTVNQMLNDASLGIAGPQTAIGDAIGLAVKQLLNYPADSKALVLLTDGGNNAGVLDPIAAAKLAAQAKVKIYTIGLGAQQLVIPGLFGSQVVNPSSDLDINSLKQIAMLTGGKFFRAEDGASLANIYAQINQLEPVKADQMIIRPIKPLYPWTLALAMLLILCLLIYIRVEEN
ncbi:MAG: hypothetical protein RLZZ293_299 [Pseudomonadota bacterium]|jgi:Ca-activated chloride channel family protein